MQQSITRFVPIFVSALLIASVGAATSVSGGSTTKNQSQDPTKAGNTQGEVKPLEIVKRVIVPKEDLPGITFSDKRGVTYVLARSLSEHLMLDLDLDQSEKVMTLGGQKFEKFRRLYAGNILFAIRDIEKLGGTVSPTLDEDRVKVESNGFEFEVAIGKKRIEVDKAAQELTAFQGDVVVLKTNVSTGAPGHNTPVGEFKTGYKERMHYSRKYNNAEMPYAVQVNGDVFFHGYPSVPPYPASHGCIRIPLGRNSPAKYLFGWVEKDIDVKIFGTYVWESRRSRRNR